MTPRRYGLLAALLLGLLLRFAAVPGTAAEKTGVCPELKEELNCTQECSSDGECADNLKCCRAGCAALCLLPNEKPGSCPKVDLPLTPLGLCRDQCQVDSECPDQMKCCLNGCGKVFSHHSLRNEGVGVSTWLRLAPAQLPSLLSGLCTPSCADHSFSFQPIK
ncbi:hypothetical protein QTO34_002334 [Cnephaeus nilssonii]|uniref:WAP four-disulfide core domain protein 2 n=1 Tax=Cnephaeus nilssonii TaxID=3371016 RepID=A0AA40HVE7_CNENI|nr:hypothetical protein QTO34_002334 [Eptesicus nilssonii]